jgi:uncharacterized membrane protein YgcG
MAPGLTPAAHAGGYGWLSVGSGFHVGGLNLSLVFGRPFGYAGTYYRFPRAIAYRNVHCTSRCFIERGVHYHDRNCPVANAYFRHYGYDPYDVYSRYAPRYDGYYDGGYDAGYYDDGYYDGGYYDPYYYGPSYGGGVSIYLQRGYSRDRHYDGRYDRRYDGRGHGGHNDHRSYGHGGYGGDRGGWNHDGGHRDGGHRDGGHRDGGHRDGGHRDGGHGNGGHRGGRH